MKLKDPLMDKFRDHQRGSEGNIGDSHGAPSGGVNDPMIVSFGVGLKLRRLKRRKRRNTHADRTDKRTVTRRGNKPASETAQTTQANSEGKSEGRAAC